MARSFSSRAVEPNWPSPLNANNPRSLKSLATEADASHGPEVRAFSVHFWCRSQLLVFHVGAAGAEPGSLGLVVFQGL